MGEAHAASVVHDLKVIGIGPRGVSAMQKLSGSFSTDADTELWAIDSSEKKVSASNLHCSSGQSRLCRYGTHVDPLIPPALRVVSDPPLVASLPVSK